MSKYSAEEFAEAGFSYMGVSYETMDCQKFVEKCMADVGLKMDLPGSNAWYREIMKNGWCGTPEECKAEFGRIPKGALVFIREDVSEDTPGKYRDDGIGDITHIGIKTGRGKGAIHSSKSRGGVCESDFKDKTIPNGGWNRVGLYRKFTYGEDVDSVLDGGSGGGDDPGGDVPEGTWARVVSPNGKAVNTRKGPDENYDQAGPGKLPPGTMVEIISTKENQQKEQWAKIRYIDGSGVTWVCWMKRDFLEVDGGEVIPEPDPEKEGGSEDEEEKVRLVLNLTREQARLLLKVADNLGWQLEQLLAEG